MSSFENITQCATHEKQCLVMYSQDGFNSLVSLATILSIFYSLVSSSLGDHPRFNLYCRALDPNQIQGEDEQDGRGRATDHRTDAWERRKATILHRQRVSHSRNVHGYWRLVWICNFSLIVVKEVFDLHCKKNAMFLHRRYLIRLMSIGEETCLLQF